VRTVIELFILEMIRIKENIRKNHDAWNERHPFRRWCISSKSHHKQYIFNISLDELETLAINTPICPICGTPLNFIQSRHSGKNNKMSTYSPTLDRINNEQEMNIDNVWIICNACNRAKSDKPLKEFIKYCKMIVNKFDTGV